MAATLFYLVRHPAALAKATQEVRAMFDNIEEIFQGPRLTSCTYLRACIDEAMRLAPSVGGLLPREALPGGMTVDGEAIPAGTVVGTPHYTIHHNPDYFPDPFSFVPERWIAGSVLDKAAGQAPRTVGEREVSRAQSAFCAFSVGPRGCIGKGLAYVEMMTTLAWTLFAYDLRRAVGVVDPSEGDDSGTAEWGRDRVGEYQLVDTFTSLKNGPMVEFRPRMA